MQKIPYLLIIGDKEIAAGAVGVRQRGKGDLGAMPVEEFLKKVEEEVKTKI
jgi:threonyl-tRNA synthetase